MFYLNLNLSALFFFFFYFLSLFLCRPLTEEEIVDLREKHYDSIVEKQKDLDMKIQKEVISLMLLNIFYPNTPLNDGAVIISNNQVKAAGCLLPLCESKNSSFIFLPSSLSFAAR